MPLGHHGNVDSLSVAGQFEKHWITAYVLLSIANKLTKSFSENKRLKKLCNRNLKFVILQLNSLTCSISANKWRSVLWSIIIKKNISKEQSGYIKLKTQFREMTSIKLLTFWYFHRNKSFSMWKRGYDLVTESFI